MKTSVRKSKARNSVNVLSTESNKKTKRRHASFSGEDEIPPKTSKTDEHDCHIRSNSWPRYYREKRDPIEEYENYLQETVKRDLGIESGSTCRNAWGNLSYAQLISKAIESSSWKRLSLSEICDWITKYVPYFRDKTDSKKSWGWKNSIRHNLSLHSKFVRVPTINSLSNGPTKYVWTIKNDGINESPYKRYTLIRRKKTQRNLSQKNCTQTSDFWTDNRMETSSPSARSNFCSPNLEQCMSDIYQDPQDDRCKAETNSFSNATKRSFRTVKLEPPRPRYFPNTQQQNSICLALNPFFSDHYMNNNFPGVVPQFSTPNHLVFSKFNNTSLKDHGFKFVELQKFIGPSAFKYDIMKKSETEDALSITKTENNEADCKSEGLEKGTQNFITQKCGDAVKKCDETGVSCELDYTKTANRITFNHVIDCTTIGKMDKDTVKYSGHIDERRKSLSQEDIQDSENLRSISVNDLEEAYRLVIALKKIPPKKRVKFYSMFDDYGKFMKGNDENGCSASYDQQLRSLLEKS